MTHSLPSLLTQQQELFCLAYVKHGVGHMAVVEAGYKARDTEGSSSPAAVQASRLLHNDNVLARIRELRSEAASTTVMSVRERMEYLSEIARANITDYVRAGREGIQINIGPESPNPGAIREVTSITDKHGRVIRRISLRDSVKAIAELNKMYGAN